ncbi:tRNA (adenosine(37)-N6)-threonylcarbamoyltransferase complex dimerization subunit type 1 TsaB [Myxococcota bacterium]|nr:tRNA (adenosine(37)-N6)-threonylcarbamoyltransferase complex dimerization subunit type 1 TsaB [Myxococcota bacterium]
MSAAGGTGGPGPAGPGPVVLGIDTAAPVIGAALWLRDRPGPAWQLRAVRGADVALLPAVQRLLGELERVGLALDRVAVTVGPGAFTGLRVGVATALGLALSRGLPVAPVDALLARACRVPPDPADPGPILALLDARKGRVYAAAFAPTDDLPAALGPAVDLPLDAVLPAPPFLATGEGACGFADRIVAAGGRVHPQADASAAPAVARLGARLPALDAGAVALRYLRDADAVPPTDLGHRVGS